MQLEQKALELAKRAHHGQTDKAGQAYINHPIAVAGVLTNAKEKTVALLHDVLEDSPYTAADLLQIGFPTDVVVAVQAITKRSGEKYEDYLARVKKNPLACVVKMADIRHNMDLSRLPTVTANDLERTEKYAKALIALER